MMAVQRAQVDVCGEVEQRRDADLVQRGDRRPATSLAFLMPSMRFSSGATGLAPSRSTAASSRPLAQKSPRSFCTLPCGDCIEASSNSRCCCCARAVSWPSAEIAPDGGIGLLASQALLASAWKSEHATATAGAFFFAAGFFAARLSGAALPATRATSRAKASGRGVGMRHISDRTGGRV
jgi:hypothetical protein